MPDPRRSPVNVLRAVDAFFRPAYPAKRLAALRILIGGFATFYSIGVAITMRRLAHAAPADFAPTGPVAILSGPLPPWAFYAVTALTLASSVPFTLGYRYRITGPLFAAAFLWTGAYRSSFSMIFHTENLLALHLVVLAMGDAAAVWSLDARRARSADPPPDDARFGWPVRLLSLVTVAAYVLAGVAKLRLRGTAWLSGETLSYQIAYDNARKAVLGDTYSPIGGFVVRHTWLMRPLAILAVALELGAPLALVGRRAATVWAIVAWGFHAGVLALMAIFFPYPTLGLAFLSLFAPERIIERILAWTARRRAPTPHPEDACAARGVGP
ncbi:MAG: HTTM domain-containing protein [Polyangiaceae bacterium]